jgi:hypothetical protein
VIGLIVGAEGFLALFVFFLAYFVAYEPYRALYPDLVSDEIAGRGQSTQAVWRGAGTGLALVGGGLLYGVGRAAPFLASAVLAAVSMFRWWGRLARSSRKGGPQPAVGSPVGAPSFQLVQILNDLGARFGSVERLSGREIVPFANGLEKESRGPRMPAGAPIVTRLCRQLAGEVLWLHRSLPSF